MNTGFEPTGRLSALSWPTAGTLARVPEAVPQRGSLHVERGTAIAFRFRKALQPPVSQVIRAGMSAALKVFL
jgi:hypothetical protein